MYLSEWLLLALVGARVAASSAEKPQSVSLKVHHKYKSLGHYLKHLGSLQMQDHADIPLEAFAQDLYYGAAKVGTPGQDLNLLFETGYADTYLPSSEFCKNKMRHFCDHHKVYNEHKSSTYKKNGTKWHTNFYAMVAYGHLSEDNIQIGGLVVKNQLLGVAVYADPIKDATFDGVVGMAYRSLSHMDTNPVFVNMIEQKVVDKPVFAFYLNKEENGPGGELVLGGVDSSHYMGEITYTPVTQHSHWFIEIQGFKLGKKKIVDQFAAIPHPNTGLIQGPKGVMEKINWALDGERQWDGSYTVNCSMISSFPDVTFTIAGAPFALTPTEYIFKWYNGKDVVCYSAFFGFKNLPYIVLGNPFLRKFYTVFDMGSNRVGFATAK